MITMVKSHVISCPRLLTPPILHLNVSLPEECTAAVAGNPAVVKMLGGNVSWRKRQMYGIVNKSCF